jgi:hypothetical protein
MDYHSVVISTRKCLTRLVLEVYALTVLVIRKEVIANFVLQIIGVVQEKNTVLLVSVMKKEAKVCSVMRTVSVLVNLELVGNFAIVVWTDFMILDRMDASESN